MTTRRSTSHPALLHVVLDDLMTRLRLYAGSNWSTRAGTLTWTVTETVDHLVDVFAWYAVQLATGATRHTPVDARPPTGATPDDRVRAATATGELLITVIEAVPDDRLGWHWMGSATADDFAIMAMTEALVHGHDVHAGLGQSWRPDDQAAQAALSHLFPQVKQDADPWALLLWAHGRVALPDRASQSDWTWSLPRDPDAGIPTLTGLENSIRPATPAGCPKGRRGQSQSQAYGETATPRV